MGGKKGRGGQGKRVGMKGKKKKKQPLKPKTNFNEKTNDKHLPPHPVISKSSNGPLSTNL